MLRFHVSNNCVTFYCVFQRVEDPREWCGPSILVEACKPYRDVRVWTSHSRMKIEKKKKSLGRFNTDSHSASLAFGMQRIIHKIPNLYMQTHIYIFIFISQNKKSCNSLASSRIWCTLFEKKKQEIENVYSNVKHIISLELNC